MSRHPDPFKKYQTGPDPIISKLINRIKMPEFVVVLFNESIADF